MSFTPLIPSRNCRSTTARPIPPEDLLTIDHTDPTGASRSDSAFFERKFNSGCVTVIVDGQDIRGYSARCGGAPLEGKVIIAREAMDRDGIVGVDIKLEGTIRLTMITTLTHS